MKTMAILIMALGAVSVGGCRSVDGTAPGMTNTSPGQKNKLEVVIDADRYVRITNARALRDGDLVKVSGTLRPKLFITRMAGHIHASFIGVDGSLVQHQLIEPSTKAFFRRSILKPKFNRAFFVDMANISQVRLKHHVGSVQACSYEPGAAL